ncbi:hypothetical protein BpHYR1_041840 [Brachionus plicatilis]|uniref:Uncharacterized protein n=1 Tax=Brachionus plicatilis TaxID=10195 RepID=A0A3M7QB49_BRAPC|nr:hypothetical protein BpHYR1_041840 [Brachionus plicatilis]
MMVRNDPPIYSQNNNIPIVVGTQQGHTVQRLPLQDIPIQRNIIELIKKFQKNNLYQIEYFQYNINQKASSIRIN